MIFILYISFLIYPIFSGWKDAVLWSKKGTEAYKFDEHIIFIGERIGVFIPIVLVFWFAFEHWINWWGFITASGCAFASFFFFHNGMYYLSRNRIDKAYVGWHDNSKTSTAPFNMPFWARLLLFICSPPIVLCYVYYF